MGILWDAGCIKETENFRCEIVSIIQTIPLQVLFRIEIWLTVELLRLLMLPVSVLSFSLDLCTLHGPKKNNNSGQREFLLGKIWSYS